MKTLKELYKLKNSLEYLTVEDLKNIARENNYSGFAKLRKAELIAKLVRFMKTQGFKQGVVEILNDSKIIFLYIIYTENGYIDYDDLRATFLKHRSSSTFSNTLNYLRESGLVRDDEEENRIISIPKELFELFKEYIISNGQKLVGNKKTEIKASEKVKLNVKPRKAKQSQKTQSTPDKIVHINSINYYNKLINMNSERIIIIDFWADWCGPCIDFGPKFKKLQQEYATKEFVFAKVDVDKNEDMCKKVFKIKAVPTILFIKKGKVIKKVEGTMNYKKMKNFLEKFK